MHAMSNARGGLRCYPYLALRVFLPVLREAVAIPLRVAR